MRKKRKRRPDAFRFERIVWSKDRRIVLIDQGALRREAERDAKTAMKDVARFRAQLEEFESRILPEFQRWESATFGALLTEERELHARLAHLQALIEQVSMESYFRGCHPHEAYAMIMREQERAARPPDEDPDDGGDDDFEDGPMPDEDEGLDPEERIFHDFLRGVLDVEPEFLHPSEYQKLFREFQRMTGGGADRREHGGRATRHPAPAADKSSRIKELYRILARRLHPDSHASAEATAGLWHDLQEAYARGDVERMEILLAITDLHEGADGSRTTLFHMRQVAIEFARAIAALKSRLGKARRTLAWKFAKQADRATLEKKIRSELHGKVAYLREEVAEHDAVIERWKHAAESRKRPQARTPASRRPPPRSSGQSFFDF